MSPNKMLLIAALFGLVILATLGVPSMPPRAPIDSCKVREADIVDIYNAMLASPEYRQEPARTRMTAELIRSAEKLCREARDRTSKPLPEELRKLAR